MLKERIQEVFEFTKSESPYSKANKGWINQDIFLDLSPSTDTVQQENEAAKITLFWSPINNFLSNIFIIIIVGSLIVFTTASFVKGRFNFNLFNNSVIIDNVVVEGNKDLNISQLNYKDSTGSEIEQDLDKKELDKSNNIDLLDEELINAKQEMINIKTNKPEPEINESKTNKNVKIIQNKKSKSNFI